MAQYNHTPTTSIPSSSTFRRLPVLHKGPFRTDKASTPPRLKPDLDHTSDASFNRPRSTLIVEAGAATSHLLPPSRSSSLPRSPSISDDSMVHHPTDQRPSLESMTHPARSASYMPPKNEEGVRGEAEVVHNPSRVFSGSVHLFEKRTETPDRLSALPVLPETHASLDASRPSPQRPLDDSSSRHRVNADASQQTSTNGPSTVAETPSREHERTRKSSTKLPRLRPVPILPCSKLVTARAPASAMYFSSVPTHGDDPYQPLRAHTGTLVGEKIWFLGGVAGTHCWRRIAYFDTETLHWNTVDTFGDQLPPLRRPTTNLVGNYLFILGGGDGLTYNKDVWLFDIVSHRISRPPILGPHNALPPARRAHSTVHYRNYLVIFGGGNGEDGFNDVWALDVSDPTRLTWREWVTSGDIPQKKGYHTANLVGNKMIVFGGSDGHVVFADIHILNLDTLVWTLVNTEARHNRLSHSSTQVGSYLFVIGGHNGEAYAQDILLFNLVTLQWETKSPQGHRPSGRGYHVAVLHDARIYVSGGYNGVDVFDDLWSLDLSAAAYLPQVTTFEIDETLGQGIIEN